MISVRPLFGYMAYHRITESELADKAGISITTISKMRKNNTFTFSTLDKICTCLNLEIKDVLRYEEDQDN